MGKLWIRFVFLCLTVALVLCLPHGEILENRVHGIEDKNENSFIRVKRQVVKIVNPSPVGSAAAAPVKKPEPAPEVADAEEEPAQEEPAPEEPAPEEPAPEEPAPEEPAPEEPAPEEPAPEEPAPEEPAPEEPAPEEPAPEEPPPAVEEPPIVVQPPQSPSILVFRSPLSPFGLKR